jgi:predicted RNA binding protein YcfA (HicA-like mRNA interferase family)
MLKALIPNSPIKSPRGDAAANDRWIKSSPNLKKPSDYGVSGKKSLDAAKVSSSAASRPKSASISDSFSSSRSASTTQISAKRCIEKSANAAQQSCSLRNVSATDVRQVLAQLGFTDRAQKGSHHNLVSPNTHRSVTVPDHGARKPLKVGTLNGILKDVQDILEHEIAVVFKPGFRCTLGKDEIRSWVSDPKASRHEIKALGQKLAGRIL